MPGTIQVISSLATQLPGQTHFALQRFERADDVQSVAVADWGTPPTTQVFRIPYAGGEFIPTTLGTGERVLDARNIGGTVTALAVGPDDDSTVEAIAIVNVSNALKRVALTSPLPPGLHVIAGSLLPDGQNGYYLALAAHDDAGAPDQLFVARWAGSPVSPVLVGNAPFAAVDSMVRTGDTTYLFNHSLGQIALTDAQPTNIDFRGWPPGVTVWPGADSETLFDVVSRTTDAAPIFAFAALPTTQAGTFDVAALPSNGDVATALLTNDDSLRWRDGLVVSAGPATGSPGRLSLIWLDAAHGMLGAELLPPTGNGGKPTAARAHVHSVSSAQPPTFDVAWTEEFTNLATPYDKLFYGQVRCE